MNFLLPKPDGQGIAQTKQLLLNKFGREVSDDEASQMLSMIMNHLFLINNPCCDTASTPENPIPTRQ